MELIKKLPAEKDKNGKWRRFGEFLCSFCNKKVKRILEAGIKCKSCGCAKNELISKSIMGETILFMAKNIQKKQNKKYPKHY